mmetsp:Transcript_47062/g.110849  ORF Transcript_47062/g.110849 Transcript_47062/m.110849 type:complete len:103 (-) Transcript_47062:442-750(-)
MEPVGCVKRMSRACLGTPTREIQGGKTSSCKKPRAGWYCEMVYEGREREQSWAKEAKRPAFANPSLNPLAPTCRFDPSHRMPLRKLQKHEARCPANPINCAA